MKKIIPYTTELEVKRFTRKAFLKKLIEFKKLEIKRQAILENRRKQNILSEDVSDTSVPSLSNRPGAVSSSDQTGSTEPTVAGMTQAAIDEATRVAEELANKVVDLSVHLPQVALGNFLLVANTDLRPMVYELSDHTTMPVGPEQALKLYADFYAFVQRDDSPGLVRTKALVAAYSEDNENLTEMAVGMYTPTDPINAFFYILAPFTGGGSLLAAAGYQGAKKAVGEAGEAAIKQTVRNRLKRTLVRDLDDDALDSVSAAAARDLRDDAADAARREISGAVGSATGRLGKGTRKGWKFNPRNWFGFSKGKKLSPEQIGDLTDAVDIEEGVLFDVMDDIIKGGIEAGADDDFFRLVLKDANLEKIFGESLEGLSGRQRSIALRKLRRDLDDSPAFKSIIKKYYKRVRELDDDLLNSAYVSGLKYAPKNLATIQGDGWIKATVGIASRAIAAPGAIAYGAGRGVRNSTSWITSKAIDDWGQTWLPRVTRASDGVDVGARGMSKQKAEKLARALTDDFVNTDEFYDEFVKKLSKEIIDPVTGQVHKGQRLLDDVFLNPLLDNADALSIQLRKVFIESPELLTGNIDDLIKVTDDAIEISPRLVRDLMGSNYDDVAENIGQKGAQKIIIKSSDPDYADVFDELAMQAIDAQALLKREKAHVDNMLKVTKELTRDIRDTNARSVAGKTLHGMFIFQSSKDVVEYVSDTTGIALAMRGAGEAGVSDSALDPQTGEVPKATFTEAEAAYEAAKAQDALAAEIAEQKEALKRSVQEDMNTVISLADMSDEEYADYVASQAELPDIVYAGEAEEVEGELPDDTQVESLQDDILDSAAKLEALAGLSYDEIAGDYSGWMAGMSSALQTYDGWVKTWETGDTGSVGLQKRLVAYFTSGDGYREMSSDINKINFINWGPAEMVTKGVGAVIDFFGQAVGYDSDIGDRSVSIDGNESKNWSGDILDEMTATVRKAVDKVGKFDAAKVDMGLKSKVLDILKQPAMNSGPITEYSDWDGSKAKFLQGLVDESKTSGIVAKLDFSRIDEAWGLFLEVAAAEQKDTKTKDAIGELEIQKESHQISNLDEKKLRKYIRKALKESKKKRLAENTPEPPTGSDEPSEPAPSEPAEPEESSSYNRDAFLKMQGELYAKYTSRYPELKGELGKIKGRMEVSPEDAVEIRTWWLSCAAGFKGIHNRATTQETQSIEFGAEKTSQENTLNFVLGYIEYNSGTKKIKPKFIGSTQFNGASTSVPTHKAFTSVALRNLVSVAQMVYPYKQNFNYESNLIPFVVNGGEADEQIIELWVDNTGGFNKETFGADLIKDVCNYFKDEVDIGGMMVPGGDTKDRYILPVLGAVWGPAPITKANFSQIWSSQRSIDNVTDAMMELDAKNVAKLETLSTQTNPGSTFKKVQNGLDAVHSVFTPLFAQADDPGVGVRYAFTDESYASLANAVEAVIIDMGFPTSELPDSEVDGSVTDTGSDSSDDDDSDESSEEGPLGGLPTLSPSKARDKFIQLLKDRTAYKQGLVVISKPEKGNRAVNNYILEFSIAAYLVKHGLEGNIETWAPTFWEGFYTTMQRYKGAKINTSIGDFANLELVFNEVVNHAANSSAGIMSDPKVKALISSGGNDWRSVSSGLRDLGYTQYLDERYLESEESDIYGWALFLRDLANGVNVSPDSPPVIPESLKRQKVMTSKAFKGNKK